MFKHVRTPLATLLATAAMTGGLTITGAAFTAPAASAHPTVGAFKHKAETSEQGLGANGRVIGRGETNVVGGHHLTATECVMQTLEWVLRKNKKTGKNERVRDWVFLPAPGTKVPAQQQVVRDRAITRRQTPTVCTWVMDRDPGSYRIAVRAVENDHGTVEVHPWQFGKRVDVPEPRRGGGGGWLKAATPTSAPAPTDVPEFVALGSRWS